MERRIGRLTALMASAVLIMSACSSTTTSSGSPGASVVPASEPATSPGASVDTTVTPAPTAIAGNASSAKPGDVEVRWYCCLGTGDAPEQVDVEQKVVEEFNASHPDIHLRFEGYPYTLARDSLAVQIASGNGPDIVGPVGIGGANAFHGQWLDLQPLIDKNHFDMTQFPESTVNLYNVAGEGQVGIPFAIYPSVLFYKASLFKEAGLAEPPHKNSTYTMPDGSTVPWDYDTVRKIAMMLTVDKNGKDATEQGFDPKNIVQWGFEPQRDDLRGRGVLEGRHARRRGRQDGPDPGRVGGRVELLLRRHLEGPLLDDRTAVPQHGHQPERLPVLHRQGRDERELPVVDLRRVRRRRRLGHRGDPVVQRPDHRRVQRGHVPDPQDDQAPRRGVRGPAVPARGGRPAQALRRDARGRVRAGCLPAEPAGRLHPDHRLAGRQGGVDFADVPNFESFMPAYNETLDLINTFGTKWQATPGLDLDKEIADLKAQMQAIWDKGGS